MNYTYILECSDGTFYTGWTNDLEKRVAAHNAGTGAKYTRSRLPVKLVYSESFETKSEAMQREAKIKKLSRKEKLDLITSHEMNSREDMIKTTRQLCDSCLYGSKTSCNYYIYTKKMRGCPVGYCNKHTPATKEEKRAIHHQKYIHYN